MAVVLVFSESVVRLICGYVSQSGIGVEGKQFF